MQINPEWLHSPSVNTVMEALSNAGKKAYFVGGSVRNHLLGAPVSDIDISTDALPTEVIEIMQSAGLKTIPTGIAHGTITAISNGEPFEITTFRRDIETDGRRAVVAFSNNIIEDACRRDFTMNAIYADKDGHIFDPINGLPDLNVRRVRFIENPDQRIAEDYLRILRFFRFHAWYGDPFGGLDSDGLAACAAAVDGINTLSKERIGAEMRKLLAAVDPAPTLGSMEQSGVLLVVLPGATTRAIAPLVHLEKMTRTAPCWRRRLVALGGENPTQNLRLSNTETRKIQSLHDLLARGCGPAEAGYRFGKQLATDGILIEAASLGSTIPPTSLPQILRGVAAVFPVRAKDLQPRFSGKALGNKLKQLERKWIATDFHATKAELLD